MLEGKMILVTGSSRGIGAATARKIIEYGGRAVLHGRTESSELKQLSSELNVPYVVADVTSDQAVRSAVDEAVSYGSIEGIVTAAGITRAGEFLELPDEDWTELFEINVGGTVRFCRALIPYMKQQGGGAIVTISSLRAFPRASERIAYGMTKAAIVALTAGLAKECAPSIRVNSVAPGFADTDMAKGWSAEQREKNKRSLAGRLAEPEEVAEPICFLLSDRASFITGQTLIADGGYLLADN